MLDGLDAVAWDELSHAYGSAHDTPGLLRQVGSPDGDVASEALADLHGSIFHQGSVYPATLMAVPFLAELATSATHQRADLTWMLGMLADDRHAHDDDFVQVRAAVTAQLDRLTALIDDDDPQVREAAAYAAARAGVPAEPLWRRWTVEDDPAARASLALALGERDAGAAEPVLRDAALHGDPAVRAAAALSLLRAGLDWPLGIIPALVAAIDDDAAVAYAWARGGEWSEEVVVAPPVPVAVSVVEQMLRSSNPETRSAGLWAVRVRCDAQRSAPAVFVPLVAPLLDDPEPEVRSDVVSVLRQAGTAAGQCADALADVAGRFSETAGRRGFTAEFQAIETLQRLGDPRWVEAVCTAAAQGRKFQFMPGTVRFAPEVLAAVQQELATRPAAVEALAPMVAHWGTDAAELVPHLVAALPLAGPPIARALLTLGCDDAAAVAHWRTQAAEDGDLRAALAVHRVTADPDAVLTALHEVLAGAARAPGLPVPELSEFGEALAPLLPVATPYLTGQADPVHPQRDRQVLAAQVVAAVSGPAGMLSTVQAVLLAGHRPAGHAADLVAELARTAPATVAQLEGPLRDRLGDRWSRLFAARALARLGVPVAELVEPLSRGITDYGGRFGPAMILELRAVETIPALEALLDRDERSDVAAYADDVVWADEQLQEEIKRVIAGLRN